jgi:GNAT superfamily N-acetyltransferase
MKRNRNASGEPAQTGEAGGPPLDRFRVDNYDAIARRIGPEDRALLHELTVGVFWPHRTDDLDLFIALGDGYLAIDEIGRAMGSSMYYTAGADFAMLGMMVTAPRLQTLGTGRWLMRRVMADCAGRDMRLSATRSGYRLYESEGFVPFSTIWQRQGVARSIYLPDPAPGVSLRALSPADEAAVAEKDGEIRGYALARKFGRGVVIGPLVAEDDAMAMMLAAPLIQRHEGEFVRLDSPVESEHFGAFLAAAGMGVYDTVTEMYFGRQRRPLDGAQLYGLAAHSLG